MQVTAGKAANFVKLRLLELLKLTRHANDSAFTASKERILE